MPEPRSSVASGGLARSYCPVRRRSSKPKLLARLRKATSLIDAASAPPIEGHAFDHTGPISTNHRVCDLGRDPHARIHRRNGSETRDYPATLLDLPDEPNAVGTLRLVIFLSKRTQSHAKMLMAQTFPTFLEASLRKQSMR